MFLRTAALFAVLATLGACASAPEGEAPVASSPAIPSAAQEEWAPVAGVLGSDTKTQEDIMLLLKSHGIESVAAGSLGYTVSVPASRASEARSLLRAAVDKGMQATVYDPSAE